MPPPGDLREEHDEDAGGDDDGAHGNDGTGTKELDHLTLHEGPGEGPRSELEVENKRARLNPV